MINKSAKIRILYISSALKRAYPEIVGFNFVAQFSQKDGILVFDSPLVLILDSMCGRQDFCVESLSCLFVSRKYAERLLFFYNLITICFVLAKHNVPQTRFFGLNCNDVDCFYYRSWRKNVMIASHFCSLFPRPQFIYICI